MVSARELYYYKARDCSKSGSNSININEVEVQLKVEGEMSDNKVTDYL